jgi:integrase
MKQDILASLSESTQSVYCASWSRFSEFVTSSFDISPYDATSEQVALYVVHLHNQKIRAKTIRSHLSSIAFNFQSLQLSPPTVSFSISKLLASYTKSDPPPLVRKPITHDILKLLVSALAKMPNTKHDRVMFTSLFTLMYHALLRISEVTPSKKHDHNLKSKQISTTGAKNQKLTISFKTFKFSTPGITQINISPTSNNICPVMTYLRYQRIKSPKSNLSFSRSDGSPLTPALVTKQLRSLLAFIKLPSADFYNHSFRIGKATDMARQGFTDTQICMAGRWSSSAFKKYIKPQLLQL